MTRRLTALLLALSLFLPEALLSQQKAAQSSAATEQSAPAASRPQPASQPPVSTQKQEKARRRSYERETNARRSRGISKKELAFMGAIAGTSMGIGALAGGARGLAVGSIVGAWGAYAGHRLWNHFK